LTVVVGQRLYQASESENTVARNDAWRRLCSVHDSLQKLEPNEYHCDNNADQEIWYNGTGQYNPNTFDPEKAKSSRMLRFFEVFVADEKKNDQCCNVFLTTFTKCC
jgi:hypothetical protein